MRISLALKYIHVILKNSLPAIFGQNITVFQQAPQKIEQER